MIIACNYGCIKVVHNYMNLSNFNEKSIKTYPHWANFGEFRRKLCSGDGASFGEFRRKLANFGEKFFGKPKNNSPKFAKIRPVWKNKKSHSTNEHPH